MSSEPDGRLLLESGPLGTRAFVECPVTGYRREVYAVEYRDGGRLTFPIDLSSTGDVEQFHEALPGGAAGRDHDASQRPVSEALKHVSPVKHPRATR